jgi:putative ATPase
MPSNINTTPLAERMRPVSFDDFVGQEEVAGQGKMLRKLVENGEIRSAIFWGPPGVGKTTLARVIAKVSEADFVELSGVASGKEDLMKALDRAEQNKRLGIRTVLFIDEIHRWNKAQQDALLPSVERGVVILIGATTENPSFEIIGALLSRSRVFVLQSLSEKHIAEIVVRALKDVERGYGSKQIDILDDALELLAQLSGGDARVALGGLEFALSSKIDQTKKKITLTKDDVKEALQKTYLTFDKKGEEFYNAISALHKSMRGSDANAALYWLARMLEGGADPLYIARRVVRFASEDIGLANNTALLIANAAFDSAHKLGYPECNVHLAHAVVYCAKAEKSNALYSAYNAAAADAKVTSHLNVPIHLRNAQTKLMKEIGYGKGYKYNPDFDGPVEQEYFPDELRGRNYFEIKKKK